MSRHYFSLLTLYYDCESSKTRQSFLTGYLSSIQDKEAKKCYLDKLLVIGDVDPYEIVRGEWEDDVDLWPAMTSVLTEMYLLAVTQKKTYWVVCTSMKEVPYAQMKDTDFFRKR